MKKHVNPSKFLHEVYTEQGGVKEYNKNQQALGVLIFAGTVFFGRMVIEKVVDKIESKEIKALKKKEEG